MSRLIFIIIWLFLSEVDKANLVPGGRVYSPIKVTGVLVGNLITPLKGTKILFYRRVPNSFPPLRGNNSSTTNYITGTAIFNSNKDNFEGFFSRIF